METILRRERLLAGASLAVLTLAAWFYLFHSQAAMLDMDMPGMVMPEPYQWGPADVFLIFIMWAVMMVAMMVPSAAPMILTFVAVNRQRQAAARPVVPVGVFLLGYLAVWTVFSALATLAQWEFHKAALISAMMRTTNPILSGGLLLAAGIFQWTPLKRACLRGCRSPLTFLMSEWREGPAGAFRMGVRHGAYCLGCCWALMAVLFVVGVMNLLWVAAIALFVLAEKALPAGEWFGRVAGSALAAVGITILAGLW